MMRNEQHTNDYKNNHNNLIITYKTHATPYKHNKIIFVSTIFPKQRVCISLNDIFRCSFMIGSNRPKNTIIFKKRLFSPILSLTWVSRRTKFQFSRSTTQKLNFTIIFILDSYTILSNQFMYTFSFVYTIVFIRIHHVTLEHNMQICCQKILI